MRRGRFNNVLREATGQYGNLDRSNARLTFPIGANFDAGTGMRQSETVERDMYATWSLEFPTGSASAIRKTPASGPHLPILPSPKRFRNGPASRHKLVLTTYH